MGRTNSSSRRKYSKKKSSKVSSEGYRKKKSRRNKSKKLRHHDDSYSSCSDDESTSSSLNSSSGSEGEYTRKRARSRSRNEIKGSKKRSRRRSLSEDSSEDSPPTVKKRKRSKKGKKIKKKKSKKVAYVSSASSDSGSCSTCKDEDSGSDELGSVGGSRGRSREKKRDHRGSIKGRTGNRKNMNKTRSSVSPSSSDELGSHGKSRGRSRERKEDHRDSTNGRIGNRKNSKSRSSFSPSRSYGTESIEKVTLENNPIRLKSVITVANMKNDELKEETVYDYDDYPSSKSNDSIELVDRFNNSPDKTSVAKEVNSGVNLNESNVSGNTGSEVDDLESILRQKALENLSKFRGGIKTKPVVSVDDKPKSVQSGDTHPTQETVSMTLVSQPVTHRSRFTWRRDTSVTTVKDEKTATYSELNSSGSQPAELKLQSANLSSASRLDNKFVNETLKTNVDQKSTVAIETQAPSTVSIEEGSSKEQKNEGNDNSQFEKKTMSVMRGGEMVQVSYKVYIPNKAPALARRQLRR